MQLFSSALIHNGTRFLASPSTIVCNDDGQIIEVLEGIQHPDAKHVGGLLCPGFINAHCHLELSYLQHQIPKHTGLVNFVQQVGAIRNNFTEQQIRHAIVSAEQHMKASGIVAVGDICNTPNTIAQKKLGQLHYHNFVEVFGVLNNNAMDRYATICQLQNEFAAVSNTTIVPHAPYSVSKQLFSLIANTADNTPISIHNQESIAEDDLVKNANGEFIPFLQTITNNNYHAVANNCSSLQYYLPFLPAQKILFVHNTFTTQQDVDFAKTYCADRHWVYCANANLYISNQLPTIYGYLHSIHENICIGTDSLASNDTLSIYAEIKTIYDHQQIPVETLLQWATKNGAKALQMPYLGQIIPNVKPGVVHIKNWVSANELPEIPEIEVLVPA
jgi:aminodeoxyfutalosine deaminase